MPKEQWPPEMGREMLIAESKLQVPPASPGKVEGWQPGDPRCDECDNGLEDKWCYCPFCGSGIPITEARRELWCKGSAMTDAADRHTPWRTQGWVPTWAYIPIKDAHHNVVAVLYPDLSHGYSRDQVEANACLIVEAVNAVIAKAERVPAAHENRPRSD